MTEELPDKVRLAAWMKERLDGGGEIDIRRIGEGAGMANALFRVQFGPHDLVLRRPPLVKVTNSAGNTLREGRLLAALGQTDVPHAALAAVCDDEGVIGAPFLLMQYIDGFVPSDPLPTWCTADLAAKKALGFELVDALAKLALVDWRGVGLEGFGKPDKFLERQVDRWLWQLNSYQCRPLEHLDDVVGWLQKNLPVPGPIGIMHGDYSMFNVMFRPSAPPRLSAIIDWDTATIGEVLMDMGHVLARWDDPGEAPSALGSSDIADRTGLATRAELAQRFADRTGFDVRQLRYYQVLSLFKLACIMEGHYANYMQAPTGDMGPFTGIGPALLADAALIARGERS